LLINYDITTIRIKLLESWTVFLKKKKLNIRKTFKSQQKLVHNNIIPVIQKLINKKIFLVTDGVIKHVVYERHRYQREELLNNQKSTS
jgi:hypothetical protein